jgi:hypothetical protein
MSTLEMYHRLQEQSNAAYKRACAACDACDYDTFQAETIESWRYANEAHDLFEKLDSNQQQIEQNRAFTSMAEGFVRGLFGGRVA